MIFECIQSNDFKNRFVAPDSNDQYKDKTGVKACRTLQLAFDVHL
jgi:hypothetical protein